MERIKVSQKSHGAIEQNFSYFMLWIAVCDF